MQAVTIVDVTRSSIWVSISGDGIWNIMSRLRIVRIYLVLKKTCAIEYLETPPHNYPVTAAVNRVFFLDKSTGVK